MTQTAAPAPPLISVVVPVYNEAENIQPFLRGLEAELHEPHEVLLVYDFPEDSTLPAVAALQPPCPNVRLVPNTLGRGVLNALKAGFQASRGDVVVVMMADRSDEPGDVARALADLDQAGHAAEPPAEAFRALGLVHKQRNENGPALQAFQKYIALAPEAPDAGLVRGYLTDLKP